MTDAREREREALADAMQRINDVANMDYNEPKRVAAAHAAVVALRRAVREADRDAAEGQEGSGAEGKRGVDVATGTWHSAEYWHGRGEAAAAIEALEREDG